MSRCQAGLVGRDARQPRAGLGRRRHRRRAHPDAHALSDHDRARRRRRTSRCRCTSWRASTTTARRSRSPRNSRTSASPSTPAPLKEAFAKKKAAGKEVKVAMTFPGGTHDLWIRYWLAAGGIDPDKDVSTIVVPPPQMVANMKVGNMDAFCVGEPWNDQLVHQDIGFTACTTGEIWKDHPEKALGMRADWVDKNPKAAHGRADGRAWKPSSGATRWRTRTSWPRSSASASGSTCRSPTSSAASRATSTTATAARSRAPTSCMKFWSDDASYPFKSHELWFLTENLRWGKLPADLDIKALIEQGQPRGPVARGGQGHSASPRPTSRRAPRAASRPSSTARSSIRPIPTAYLDSLQIKKVA